MQAADQLREEQGLSFDVLDLRSLFPYDWPAIRESVLKTGRVLIVNLPGSTRGAVESLDAIVELVPHVLELLPPTPVHVTV
jgi:pyruvate/2-oxoglutarate/acetoin dehydrogenase E1 component